ncbi:hypothetical protein GF354_05985 [Candidatus Peregrinibacteria bacterium]|nr:hypothetical protein [Candidatus Peregrinibacteria bacterium]
MKNEKKPFFVAKLYRFLTLISILAIFTMLVSPLATHAAIEAGDHFVLTVNGGSSVMDSGGTLTFTVQSLDQSNAANSLLSSDKAYIEIMDTTTWQPSTNVDIASVGSGLSVTHRGTGSAPYPLSASSDLSGTNDNVIAVNVADGTSVDNTFTVSATSSFVVFVWTEGGSINDRDSNDGGSPAGQDFQEITVASGSGAAHHLRAEAAVTNPEVAENVSVTISQLNSGGGIDTSELTDLAVSVSGTGTIVAVDGVALETPSSLVSDLSLTNGQISILVTKPDTGDLIVSPSSATLSSDAFDDDVTITFGAATTMEIVGYGPPKDQVGTPTMAPVDFMFNKDPDSANTIFPLTNTSASDFSITTGGTAATGQWHKWTDTWGEDTKYIVSFQPETAFQENSLYTASVKKTFVGATNLPSFMSALDEDASTYSFSFTTGTGGGEWSEDGTYVGDMGGEFPPIAMLAYPQPWSWDVPVNISSVQVDFDRPMDPTTLTTSNIYIKKMVDGVESSTLPSGSHTVTSNADNDGVTISGYSFEANSEYRVVVTRDVTDTTGTQLAGMPVDDGGDSTAGYGFGFENMGPFREHFFTGSAAENISAAFMGTNLYNYDTSGTISGVPVGFNIRASFDGPLDPSTVNGTNVTLKKNNSVPVSGNVFYDPMANAIEFFPSSVLLANTSYTFNMSASVTSISGDAISSTSITFTTGADDTVNPQVAFADADNYGVFIKFDEPLNSTTAINKSYYTLKTCSGQGVNSDGVKCADNSTDPTEVSLLSGVNAHYEKSENSVWMDGLSLTPGDGFYVAVGTGVTDIAGNTIHATNNKSWTGFVMDASNFSGGQGMFNMDGMGFEDMDMAQMGMMPIGVWPMNTMAAVTTKYFLDIPIASQIPANGYIQLTFPDGFGVSGVKQDADSPINNDFNGPSTGTITFDTTLPSITGLTDGSGDQANDGIGYISAADKVIIQLSAATQANDFLRIDLDGITNSNEPKDFDTAGYQVDIKTFNSSGTLLEAMTSMPFFISAKGSNSISGTVSSGATGLNGVKIYLDSPMTGPMETTTANDAASGGQDGEYIFQNLPAGNYMIFTKPMVTVGADEYYGQEWPEPITVDGVETKNFSLTAANGSNGATLPVSIAFGDLSQISNLGYNDSIDIFAGSPNGFVVKTISRATLGSSPYTTNLYLPSAGEWMVGIGPALPYGPSGMMPDIDWMPTRPQNVKVLASDIGGAALNQVSLTMTIPDKTISGTVVDGSGIAISNAEVYAYSPQGGKDAFTQASADGTFALDVVEGSYKVGAFLPGMPSSSEKSVLVDGDYFYIGGSPTASTGTSEGNPFNLKLAKPDLTIQGRVSDGTNAIPNASVWAFRTDAPSPPINTMTNSSGNYTLYVSAGEWQVEADAPDVGYIGSKSLTVTTSSLTGQNFNVTTSDLYTVSGQIDIPGTSDDSGVMVWIWGPNGGNEAKTDSSGNYSLRVRAGTYTLDAYIPGVGDLTPIKNLVVDGNEVGGVDFTDFSAATPQTLSITLKDDEGSEVTVNEDTIIDFVNTSGKGNSLFIPAGSSTGTVNLSEGEFYLDTDLPGLDFDDLTVAGAEFNNVNGTPSTDNKVDIDGTGDDLVLTLPDLYTLSGQVTLNSAGVNDAWISVYNSSTKDYFGVMSANNAAGGGQNGEYVIMLPPGSYSISANKPGYNSESVDITVAADSSNNNFALTANNRTISGSVTSSGSPVANAHIWAEGPSGAFAATDSEPDGTYTLSVKDGAWTMYAIAEGYSRSDAVTADVSSSNKTGKNFTLTTLGSSLNSPVSQSIVPSSGGSINDNGTNANIIIPPNSLGTGSDAGQVRSSETNDVVTTPTATPIGNGQKVNATDSSGNPITNLDDEIEFSLELSLSDLSANNILTPNSVDEMTNGYWDESTNNWVSLPTNIVFYDSSGDVIPDTTVAANDTLSGAGVDKITLTSPTDHFTTFAPIVPSGSTPPSTPTGLTISGGDGRASLIWNANSEGDMSTYNIWEANVTEGVHATLSHTSCNATCSKTISDLTNNTTYSFQIIAVDSEGNQSAGSTAVTVTPAASSPIVVSSGGGGASSSASSSSSEESVNLETSTIADTVYTEEYLVDEDGTVEENLTLMSTADGIEAVTFVENTSVGYSDSESSDVTFTGMIVPPQEVNSNITPPDQMELSSPVYQFGVEGVSLSADPAVVLRLPIDNGESTDSFNMYYYLEEDSEWILAEDGGELKQLEDESLVMEVELSDIPYAKFAVMKEVVSEEAETEIKLLEMKFIDTNDHWAENYIQDLYSQGIIGGYDENHFGPDNDITRAEFMKIAINAFDIELPTNGEVILPFTDTTNDEWYAPYVFAAYNSGIVTGYNDGTFGPNTKINRAEALKVLLETAQVELTENSDLIFPDVVVGQWFTKYVNYAANQGIVGGYQDGTFGPANNLKRGEVAKIVSLMIEMGYRDGGVVDEVLDMAEEVVESSEA